MSAGVVEARIAEAIGHAGAGRRDAAILICESAAAGQPPHPALLQLLATLLLQRGDSARAAEVIAASLALRPDHGPSLLVAGDAARANGSLPAALAHHLRACELMAERADAWHALAQTLRAAGRHDEAESAHLRTIALVPGHAPAWFALALVRQDRRDVEGAVAALEHLRQIAPPRAEVELNLGIVLQEAGRRDEAMRAYGRALLLDDASFGRIAHALAAPGSGVLWLDLDALRKHLRAQPA